MTEQLTPRHDELAPYGGVPEGDLYEGSGPRPGPRPERRHWTGRVVDGNPVLLDEFAAVEDEAGYRLQFLGKRLRGIDVARGLALIGMIGVHTLPEINEFSGGPSAFWWLASGNAAALFAVLAGIGLALMTGGQRHKFGQQLGRQRLRIAVRALLLILIGFAVAQFLQPPVYNILPYYGLMFLLALPFLGMRKRPLILWSLGIALISPFLIHALHAMGIAGSGEDFAFGQVIQAPVQLLGDLLLLGIYPAATWVVYLLVGICVGRLALDRIGVQIALLGYGSLLAVAGSSLSYLAIWFFGGWERMLYSSVETTVGDVLSVIKLGAIDEDLPATSLAWLTVASPHTNTFFAVMHTTGIALAVLGACLLLCRAIPKYLGFLAKLGTMTLTLYVGHLAFLSVTDFESAPYLYFIGQLLLALVIAYAWLHFFRQGPLESLVTRASGAPLRAYEAAQGRLPRRGRWVRSSARAGRHHQPGRRVDS